MGCFDGAGLVISLYGLYLFGYWLLMVGVPCIGLFSSVGLSLSSV